MIRRRFQEISTLALLAAMTAGSAMAQEALPDIEVGKPKPVPSSSKPKPAATHVAAPPPPVVAAAPQSEVQRAEEKFNATQESSSETFTTGKEINAVPFSRPGEALETAVPGLMVTQHSGEGKANQYQLRGFQLDHGTDLAIWLDGMPLNMPNSRPRPRLRRRQFPHPGTVLLCHWKKGAIFRRRGRFLRRRRGAYSI